MLQAAKPTARRREIAPALKAVRAARLSIRAELHILAQNSIEADGPSSPGAGWRMAGCGAMRVWRRAVPYAI
jgi:hypothetical protein